MDMSKFESINYYHLKMLDGKYHIFRRINVKPQIILEEVYAVDNIVEAENVVEKLNKSSRNIPYGDWSFTAE